MNDSTSITDGQRRMLVAINDATCARGFAPTLRELGAVMSLSVTRVHQLLAVLKADGLVSWLPLSPRTLAITDAGRTLLDTSIERRTA